MFYKSSTIPIYTTPYLSTPVAYEAGVGGGRPPPRLEKFRTNSVFRASTTCSKILNDKKYFNTGKILGQTVFFSAIVSCSIFWMIKNIYSLQWIQGKLCFSGQAQVAQKSWMIKNISIGLQWKIWEQTLFFRANAGW